MSSFYTSNKPTSNRRQFSNTGITPGNSSRYVRAFTESLINASNYGTSEVFSDIIFQAIAPSDQQGPSSDQIAQLESKIASDASFAFAEG